MAKSGVKQQQQQQQWVASIDRDGKMINGGALEFILRDWHLSLSFSSVNAMLDCLIQDACVFFSLQG